MKTLCYYGHRFGGDPAMLARARERFAALKELWKVKHPNRVLWAPWIEMAEARISEYIAWDLIEMMVGPSVIVVLDIDGAPLSQGMLREQEFGLETASIIETIDGDIEPGSEET